MKDKETGQTFSIEHTDAPPVDVKIRFSKSFFTLIIISARIFILCVETSGYLSFLPFSLHHNFCGFFS